MKRILIVEDEQLLALMLEDLLMDDGYEVVHAFDLSEAAKLVEHTPLDAAVLDINVRGELVFPLARRLRDRNIRFLFASSAYRVEIPADLCWHPLVSKPYAADEVIAEIEGLFAPLPQLRAAAEWPGRRTGEHPVL